MTQTEKYNILQFKGTFRSLLIILIPPSCLWFFSARLTLINLLFKNLSVQSCEVRERIEPCFIEKKCYERAEINDTHGIF